MSNFYAVTWVDGSFASTECVLQFSSRAARDAYRMQCAQRFEPINCKDKNKRLASGAPMVRQLWDSSEPAKFVSVH